MKTRQRTQRNKRKKRKGEYICRCNHYPFPHRMFSGDCDGGKFVREFWESNLCGECRHCILYQEQEDGYDPGRGGVSCQVLDGLEPYLACPALQEFVRYEDVKLTGRYALIMRKR